MSRRPRLARTSVLGALTALALSASMLAVTTTADGAVAMAAPTTHWPVLCEAIGRPDLIDDERTATNRSRNANRQLVTEVVEGWLSERTTAEVRAWARAAGITVPDRGRLRPEVWRAFEAAAGDADG